MKQVSIIGCGNMGSAMIQTLARHGQELVIWNRTPSKAHALAQPGVTVAESFTDALASSPVAIFVLSDPAYAAATALLQQNSVRIGRKTIVQLSSGGQNDARKLPSLVNSTGGVYLDGAILVDPAVIGTPKGAMIYSGDRAAFETIKPMLEILGKAHFVGEDVGIAATFEMALNIAGLPMEVGLLQARKICQLQNGPLELFDTLVQSFLTNHLARLLEWVKQPGDATTMKSGATVSLLAEIAAAITDHLKSQQVDANMFEALTNLYASGVASGRGDDDSLCVADLSIAAAE